MQLERREAKQDGGAKRPASHDIGQHMMAQAMQNARARHTTQLEKKEAEATAAHREEAIRREHAHQMRSMYESLRSHRGREPSQAAAGAATSRDATVDYGNSRTSSVASTVAYPVRSRSRSHAALLPTHENAMSVPTAVVVRKPRKKSK
jgi:hypothetical protein